MNRRLADNQSPLQSATTPAPVIIPSSVPLTLPRTNKLFPNRYETRTPASSTTQPNTISGLMKNPIVQNPNIHQTIRTTARSMGVGVTENSVGLTTFNKSPLISSTSTPMERFNAVNKASGNPPASTSAPTIIENNNGPTMISNGTKTKTASIGLQGGLRRAGLSDKPILPSAYFPKTLH